MSPPPSHCAVAPLARLARLSGGFRPFSLFGEAAASLVSAAKSTSVPNQRLIGVAFDLVPFRDLAALLAFPPNQGVNIQSFDSSGVLLQLFLIYSQEET